MAKGCRDPKNWGRILAKRSDRQQRAIRELRSADEETRVLAVHKLCPCRPGNFELFERYLYPLRHDSSKPVREAVNQALNEGLEQVRLRDRRAWSESPPGRPMEERKKRHAAIRCVPARRV